MINPMVDRGGWDAVFSTGMAFTCPFLTTRVRVLLPRHRHHVVHVIIDSEVKHEQCKCFHRVTPKRIVYATP